MSGLPCGRSSYRSNADVRPKLTPMADRSARPSETLFSHLSRREKVRGSSSRSLWRAMTPPAATRVKLHEDRARSVLSPLRRVSSTVSGPAIPPAAELKAVDIDGYASASLVWREALHRRLLGLADITSTVLVLVVMLNGFDQHHVALAALAGVALVLVLFKVAGLYDRDELRLVHSTLDEVPLLLQLTGLFALGVAILQTSVLASALGAEQIAALWIASFGTILIGRALARAVAGRASPIERCLVFGEIDRVEQIRAKLSASRAHALVVASLPLAGEYVEDADWATMPGAIRRVVRELNVHRIIIAPTTTDSRSVVNLIRTAKAVGVRVSVLPRMFEVVGSAVEFDYIDGMTMLGVRRFGLSRSSRLLKRAFDLVVGSIGLLIISPLVSAIALAIRLDSRGPVLFRQVRVGRDGKHFRMFKFRSMVVDADARKDELRSRNEAGDGLFKLADDPRVTRVGRVLRQTSLDELPQLFNALRGEMSLVGPRPLVVDEDAQVLGLDRSRLHLTPGMTGPWQILGYRVPMQEMVAIDYLYVANWSLWLDLKVLVRTFRHVLRRSNA
jgi:exopolysaccharide biosynthesis polyprenyl glycosylphosphotransferase